MNQYDATQSMEKDTQSIVQLLGDMDQCISEQENIIHEEREAMRLFDAEALTNLLERRVRAESTLRELESRSRRMGGELSLEQLIDTHAPNQADILQSNRIDLFRRLQTLEKEYVENHIRLRAAWNVTTSILENIGVIETRQTYQNTYTMGAR